MLSGLKISNEYNISIIIPILNEEIFINELFEKISMQDFDFKKVEVLLIDGGSNDKTLELINEKKNKMPFEVRLLHNPDKIPPAALNIGLLHAKGEIIVRMDAHSSYGINYLRDVIDKLINNREDTCNVGGVALAKGYDRVSSVVATALNCKFVIGGATFRYAKKEMEVDTLFPGTWWKEDLKKVGGWNEDWRVNEDSELSFRMKKVLGKKIKIFPDIQLNYYPRNTLRKLFSQYFRYGFWRTKTFKAYPESLRFSHMAPPTLTGTILITLLLSLIFKFAVLLLLIELLIYGCFLSYLSFTFFKKSDFLLSLICICIIQISWGVGHIISFFKFGIPINAYLKSLKRVIK